MVAVLLADYPGHMQHPEALSLRDQQGFSGTKAGLSAPKKSRNLGAAIITIAGYC